MQRRNLCDVIRACLVIAPELTDALTPIARRAFYIAPEVQPCELWTEAHNVFADWSKSGVPVETIDRVGRIWAGIDPLPETLS